MVRSNRKGRLNRASILKRLEVGQSEEVTRLPRGVGNGWLIGLKLNWLNTSSQGCLERLRENWLKPVPR